MKIFISLIVLLFTFLDVKAIEVATVLPPKVEAILNNTRRILIGNEVRSGRQYMVYLKLPHNSRKKPAYRKWLCGGVIIHEDYILTSAACIEDAQRFYVVSGTYKYDDEDDKFTNMCIKYGAKKAIWKCVPKNYIFDGHENDNIRWMNNDIAVVQVEDGFDFSRRVKGCDFVPRPICYNNQSTKLEQPGTRATIAGWGTTYAYNDWINRRRNNNARDLLETNVEVINKRNCKKRWGSRYHNIIENYMICSRDVGDSMSEICNEKYVDCTDMGYDDDDDDRRRTVKVPTNVIMDSAFHNETSYLNGTTRRTAMEGGFCENDHGGPMVYGTGQNSVVIGVISACLVKDGTNRCYGPFLYTSVYKNRHLIDCAIYKDITNCNKLFRVSETHEEFNITWPDPNDSPVAPEVEDATTHVATDSKITLTSEATTIKN